MKKSHRAGLIGIIMAAVSIMTAVPACAEWCHNSQGWWYGLNTAYTDWYKGGWQWIDGNGDGVAECYYFDANGYALTNTTTPDGYTVNADGAWVDNGSVQTKTSGIPEINIATSITYQDTAQSTTTSSSSSDWHERGYRWINLETGEEIKDDENDNKAEIDDVVDLTHDEDVDTSSYAQECFDLVNKKRTAAGLSKLKWDDTFAEACDIRAQELPEKFSHLRPNGEICFTVFDEVGIKLSGEGENLAEGYSTPKAAVTAWMNSKGHKENILDKSWKKSAIGVYYDSSSNKYYWVQLFGK